MVPTFSLTVGCSRLWGQKLGFGLSCQYVKGSPYSITERKVPELIPVLGSQPAGDVSHKPDGRLPLLSARPAVTPTILKRAATNFAAWWTEAQWLWTVCLRLFEPGPFCAWVQHANHSATEPPLLSLWHVVNFTCTLCHCSQYPTTTTPIYQITLTTWLKLTTRLIGFLDILFCPRDLWNCWSGATFRTAITAA